MDQHSPLQIWRALCRAEFRKYRERWYSAKAFRTSSAHRQFIIELHAHWRAMDALSMEAYVPRPGSSRTYSQRSTFKWKYQLDRAHGVSERAAAINYGSGYPYTRRYYGYLAFLRTEARKLIFCEKCALQKRATANCDECKEVRKDLPKEALCRRVTKAEARCPPARTWVSVSGRPKSSSSNDTLRNAVAIGGL